MPDRFVMLSVIELLVCEPIVSPVVLGLSVAVQKMPALLLFAVSEILTPAPLHRVVFPEKASCGAGFMVTVTN